MDEYFKLFSDKFRKALEEKEAKKPFETISSIYTASKARILTVTDKLLRNEQPAEVESQSAPTHVVPIPWQEKWDLKMGDKVRVNSGLSDFRSISRRTVGWKPSYEKALNKVGYITSICSAYDCHVQVLFPELPMLAEIYAGLLSKTKDDPGGVRITRFHPGDMVIIKAPLSLVALLQRGYETLPKAFLEKVGRVIAVDCEKAVHASFTGTFTVKVNPALLQIGSGEIEIDVFENSKGITPDDEVIVTRQLKKIVESQKKIKEWERWMSRLPGKTLRVLLVKQDGLLRVCDKAGRSFNIHTDVVWKKEEQLEEEAGDDEGVYQVGEWVTVKKIQNASKVLEDKSIPISLLQYLQKPAKIISYDEDLNPGITFDSMYTITVPLSALEKVLDTEKKEAKRIEEAASDLKPGDEVVLNLGPPYYIRDVLLEHEFSASVIEMVTSKATFKGFLGPKHGLIECSDGSLRKINRVYLTVPQKFRSPVKGKLGFDLSQTNSVVSIIENCLEKINQEKTSSQVQIETGIKSMYVEKGEPSTIRIGIRSHLADAGSVKTALCEPTSMKFDELSDDILHVYEVDELPTDLLVRLDFDCLPSPKSLLSVIPGISESENKVVPRGFECNDKGDAVTEKAFARKETSSEEVKSRPPPTSEIPTEEQTAQRDPMAGYQHLEMNLDGRRIQIPYRIPEYQQPDPNDPRNRREEPSSGVLTRITLEGDIRNLRME